MPVRILVSFLLNHTYHLFLNIKLQWKWPKNGEWRKKKKLHIWEHCDSYIEVCLLSQHFSLSFFFLFDKCLYWLTFLWHIWHLWAKWLFNRLWSLVWFFWLTSKFNMLIMSSTVLLIISDCFRLYILEIIKEVFLFLIFTGREDFKLKRNGKYYEKLHMSSDLYSDAPWTPIITCILTEVGLLVQNISLSWSQKSKVVPCALNKVVT